jgi:hypothetical protein
MNGETSIQRPMILRRVATVFVASSFGRLSKPHQAGRHAQSLAADGLIYQ